MVVQGGGGGGYLHHLRQVRLRFSTDLIHILRFSNIKLHLEQPASDLEGQGKISVENRGDATNETPNNHEPEGGGRESAKAFVVTPYVISSLYEIHSTMSKKNPVRYFTKTVKPFIYVIRFQFLYNKMYGKRWHRPA